MYYTYVIFCFGCKLGSRQNDICFPTIRFEPGATMVVSCTTRSIEKTLGGGRFKFVGLVAFGDNLLLPHGLCPNECGELGVAKPKSGERAALPKTWDDKGDSI